MFERITFRMGWYVFLFLSLLGVIYFIYFHPYAFNYFKDTSHYGLIYLFGPALALLTGVLVSNGKEPLKGSVFTFIVLSAMFLYLLFSRFYSMSNEYFFTVVFMVLYFVLGNIFFDTRILKILSGFILSVYVLELVLGGYQAASSWNSYFDAADKVTGTFLNSGTYSIYIAAHLPLAYYFLFRTKTYLFRDFRFNLGIFLLLLSLVALILYFTRSRIAVLCLLVLAGAKLSREPGLRAWLGRRRHFVKGALISGVVLAAGLVCYYLYGLKIESSMGRMLILRVAWQHVLDNIWLGTGIGRFSWMYPQWQAQYFANTSFPPAGYYMHAGETFLAFNEYIQLWEEWGLAGVVVLAGWLTIIFRKRAPSRTAFHGCLRSTLAILLFCAFAYPVFHCNYFLFLIAVCVAGLTPEEGAAKLKGVGRVFLLIPSIAVFAGCIGKIRAWNKWEQVKVDPATREEMIRKYEDIYSSLKYDGKFLADYGEFLMMDSASCMRSAEILRQSQTYFISYRTVDDAGRAYALCGDYRMALDRYRWLSNYIPGRILPKFRMLDIYSRTNDTSNVLRIGHMILNMPVKIYSPEVGEIKQQTKLILAKFL